MQPPSIAQEQEPFVDAERAARFLSISPKTLLAKSRAGQLPAHPIGEGVRKIWRFRLSELTKWLERETVELNSHRGRNERDFS